LFLLWRYLVSLDLRLDRLQLLDDKRLLIVAKNVKKYEANEDLSDLVLELVARIERMEEVWSDRVYYAYQEGKDR
jgi:hypothetical protein